MVSGLLQVPAISIVIPVYNVEDYLVDCLDSVNEQTFDSVEVILVDDGSTDSSGDICDEYIFDRWEGRVIHKRNGGLSDARNVGIDAASGEYLFLLDSDDFLHPKTLERLFSLAQQYEADIVECEHLACTSTDDVVWKQEVDGKAIVMQHDEALASMLDCPGFRIVAWNKLYRRDLFDGIRYPKGRLHEDEYITPLLVDRCGCYVRAQDTLYAYRNREGSIVNTYSEKRISDALDARTQRFDFFSKRYNKKYDCIILYSFLLFCSDTLFFQHQNLSEEYKAMLKSKAGELTALLRTYKHELNWWRQFNVLTIKISPMFNHYVTRLLHELRIWLQERT